MERMKCCNFCAHYTTQEIATIFTGDGIFPGRGTCRFNPPVVIMTEQQITETVWPEVHGLDICSKFRRPSFLSKILDKLFASRQTPSVIPHDATDPEKPWHVLFKEKRPERASDDRREGARRRYEKPPHKVIYDPISGDLYKDGEIVSKGK